MNLIFSFCDQACLPMLRQSVKNTLSTNRNQEVVAPTGARGFISRLSRGEIIIEKNQLN